LLRRGIRASAPVASARLSLRGGKSDAAEVTRGAGNTTKTWEDKDQDSRSDDDDSKEWDYGKFGMTKPVVEDGQNLNAVRPLPLPLSRIAGHATHTRTHAHAHIHVRAHTQAPAHARKHRAGCRLGIDREVSRT
jgi:hypothetical protein